MTQPSSPSKRSNAVDEPGSGNCSVLEVSFSILNCTVGSGILALPFALKDSGFGLGLTLSVVVSVLCWFALYILIVTGQRIGVYKYAALCEATMGSFGVYLLSSVLFFQAVGACITYMIVIGDTIPVVLEIVGINATRQWTIFVSSLIFILPLLFYRSVGSLAKASIVSVATLPPILLVVAIRGFHYAPEHKRSYEFVGDNVFPAIGVMAFAMLSTQTAFLNFTTMKQPTRKAWAHATIIAVFLSWLVSFAFAIFGFIAFGVDVKANIFNSFPLTDGLINFGRGLLGFSMFLTFPQAFYPARTALHSAFGHEDNVKIPTDNQHLYTTIGLFVPILICGVFVKDLGLLYQLIGGFCSTFLAYIIPALCYFLVFWKKNSALGSSSRLISEDEHGESRYDDEEDSQEDEEERLLKKAAANRKQHHMGHEEEQDVAITGTAVASYGATDSSSSSASASSQEDLLATAAHMRQGYTNNGSEKTDLWLDIGSGVLLVFGVFVMVISTSLTLKKMLGAV
ncbi:transmembrane amino acid transporter protein-domain-containing protein [Gamsiella multidivaricata]|uniref:transmembrane amino acid transporter protein-domain-containing protein n=1 Tax=Gamsiella multidivaricata TaxID=101098 RepID=UPI00221F85A6|nr:transmembrane amino acid transporter protein-domain-containing protein [Gamsiella multidivaricata]KAI7832698.1 transmembrane amino acid transporter protein-domain-containing protein [Gamsiella multidivaricata]